MGLRIGLRCAIDGYQVTMYDISEESLQKALQWQDRILKGMVKGQQLDIDAINSIKGRIQITTNAQEAAAQTDIMNESITENLDIKKKVYEQFASLWPEHTILTTNTSSLRPSQFAQESGRPDRFCAFHFHDVFHARVVDVMPVEETRADIPDLLMEFGKKIHQIPVLIQNEVPGYLFNNMLIALIGAAGTLRANNIASVEDIDRSWMGNMHTKVGPFGMLDQIGLDTAWHVTSGLKDKRSQAFAAFLRTYVDAGKLGIKTGEGFYSYPNPTYAREDFLE